MSNNDDARSDAVPPPRLYLRPAPEESSEEFGSRATSAVLAMIAKYEHPEDDEAPEPSSEPERAARARARQRLESLRRAQRGPEAT